MTEENAVAVPGNTHTPEPLPTNRLALWAYEARQAHSIAQSLAQTTFVPAVMRGNVGDITGVILAGAELGMQPIAALRSINMIQGTPALTAVAMRGLVQNQGHEIEVVESSDTRCVVRGRRGGTEQWQTVVWTIERAAQMGLTGKQQWKIQPTAMLIARATSELCRLIAADVLLAMPYAAEELVTGDRVVTMAEVTVEQPMADPRRVTLDEISDTPHTVRTVNPPSPVRPGVDIVPFPPEGPTQYCELHDDKAIRCAHLSHGHDDEVQGPVENWPEIAGVPGAR